MDLRKERRTSHVGRCLMKKEVRELSERHFRGSEEGMILHSFERMALHCFTLFGGFWPLGALHFQVSPDGDCR